MGEHWPQYLTLASLALTVVGHAFGAGRKPDARLAWVHFLVGLMRSGIPLFVLYEGGFFASIGWGVP